MFSVLSFFFPPTPELSFDSFLHEVLLPVAEEACCSVAQEGGGEATWVILNGLPWHTFPAHKLGLARLVRGRQPRSCSSFASNSVSCSRVMRAALCVSLGCTNGDEGSLVARLERAPRALEGVGPCAVKVCGQARILILLLSWSLFLRYHSTLLGAIPAK